MIIRFVRTDTILSLVVTLAILPTFGDLRAQTQLPGDPKRIIGGEVADSDQFPFLVGIVDRFVFENFGGFLAQFCAGTLISPQWVLTAAHCVDGVHQADVIVLMGTADLDAPDPTAATVREVVVHPAFEGSEFKNDIALLRLDRLASSPELPFIEDSADSRMVPGTMATIAGWGARAWDSEGGAGDFPSLLHQAQVPIVDNQPCAEAYSSIALIDETHICAGLLEQGGVDTCAADSGGPLLVSDGQQFFQAGITSFGNGCGQPEFPGVYTRVAAFTDWIREHAVDRMHFVQFADGPGITSDIVVVNPSPTHSLAGQLEVWDVDGGPIAPESVLTSTSPPPIFELEPQGTLTFSSRGGTDLVLGSAVVSSNIPAGGVVRFEITGLGVAGVGVGAVAPAFIAPVRREGPLSTGVAVRNPGAEPVTVTFELKDQKGNPIPGGSTDRVIPPEGRLALFIEELFPALDTVGFRGSLCVRTEDGVLAALALELGSVGQFTTLPVNPVP